MDPIVLAAAAIILAASSELIALSPLKENSVIEFILLNAKRLVEAMQADNAAREAEADAEAEGDKPEKK